MTKGTQSVLVSGVMERGKLALVYLLACCLVPTASGVCFNGTLSVQELAEMKLKGCSSVGEKLHVKQDGKLVYYLVCSPVFTCAKGTYAFVDVEKCRVICKICEENHFQPEEMKTDESLLPACSSIKHRCNQDTKMTCWPNSPEQDDMCRCDWRKGYRPQNDSCRHGCYTERDKSCGLCVKDSTCKEGEELNETYHCVPSMVKPCAASRDPNGSSTPAPGVRSATTTANTESTSSPTSSTRSAELVSVSDSEECHCDDGTWRIVAAVFIALFICCVIIIIMGVILWKRWKSGKNLCPLFRRQPQEADIQMMPLAEAQKNEKLELECKAYNALWKNSLNSLSQVCDRVKSVMDEDGPKKEVMIVDLPEEVGESTIDLKKPDSRARHHEPKHQKRTSREPASRDEMELLLQKGENCGLLDNQVSSAGFAEMATSQMATSLSDFGRQERSSVVAVTMRHPEPEGATGGADDQEQSPTPRLAQSNIT